MAQNVVQKADVGFNTPDVEFKKGPLHLLHCLKEAIALDYDLQETRVEAAQLRRLDYEILIQGRFKDIELLLLVFLLACLPSSGPVFQQEKLDRLPFLDGLPHELLISSPEAENFFKCNNIFVNKYSSQFGALSCLGHCKTPSQ